MLRPLFRGFEPAGRSSGWFFAAATAFFGLAALASSSACKPEHPECKKDKHCFVEEGEKCVDGICQNCVTDEDCVGKGENGENLQCVEFRCGVGGAGAGGVGEQGAPCASTIECGGGLVCKAGICDLCIGDIDCVSGACNVDTGRCADGTGSGAGQCSIDDDCAIDEICDAGLCIFSGDFGGENHEVLCDLQAIFFGFDSPTIAPEAKSQLETAAQCLSESGRSFFLEAHADPRGTEEYNILLTDKRGQGVKQLLVTLGVPAENMTVISKGSLEATGVDESSWSKDRRVEFIPQ